MPTDAQLWPLSRLGTVKGQDGQPPVYDPKDPVHYAVPEFQRSLVWPKKKQRLLIQSILRGYPIGALLLVEYGKEAVDLPDGSTKPAPSYGIIDGLQRSNAIANHLARPLEVVTTEALDIAQVQGLAAALAAETGSDVDADDVEDALLAWMHRTLTTDPVAGFEHDTALDAVTDALSLPSVDRGQAKRLRPHLIKLLESIKAAVDISAIKIPILVYSGPRADLPEIFARINTQGTVLSKYEIFAAAWVGSQVNIADADIRKAIDLRYAALEKEGFQILRDKTAATYSLFDYFYGLSQVLGQRFPRLYSASEAKRGTSSVAFPVAALVLGRPVDEMANLPNLLPQLSDGTYDVAPLETAILASAALVNNILAKHLGLSLTKEGEALAHGELQMASIVAAASTYLYDASKSLKKRPLSASLRKKLESGIPQHYLYDILRQEWRGPLYTYAYERVWAADGKRAGYYERPVDKKGFRAALATSLLEQLSEATRTRRNITATDRAVLKFIYSAIITTGEQQKFKFDVEHLIPVGRIQKMTENQDPWPIGALANLAILPSDANRAKNSLTLAEYVALPKGGPDPETLKMVQKLSLVPMQDVAIPKAGGADIMSESEYKQFLERRWAVMSKTLIKNLGL